MCYQCQDQDKAAAQEKLKGFEGAEPAIALRGTYDDPRFASEATLKAPMKEVPSALMLQDEANNRLSKAVEILHDRTAALRHSGVERGEEDRAVRDYGSEVARSISEQAYRTDMAARVIEKILTEMEI